MKHPAAQDALRYIKSRPEEMKNSWLEAFANEDSQLAGRCWSTLSKIMIGEKEPVDIDILGLAYVMKQGECG